MPAIIRRLFCAALVWGLWGHGALAAGPQHPDCSGRERWPAIMTGMRLKELGLSEKAGGYDRVEVELLASEPLPAEKHGRSLFRQVHKVTIEDGGRIFTAITVNTASFEECSESGADVYVIAVACPAGGRCARFGLPRDVQGQGRLP